MRLSRLTGLEREKLAAEYGALAVEIERLRAILADPSLLMSVIIMELEEVKARFADPRRTEIVPAEAEIQMEDLIQEEDMVVTISSTPKLPEAHADRRPIASRSAAARGRWGWRRARRTG